MIRLLCALTAIALSGSANAAELVMFSRDGCPYCARFERDIAPIWPKTELGRRVPLRRVDIHKTIPPDLAAIAVERITPVFVVVEAGREIGRIRGYPGDDHFWGLVAGLMGALPAKPAATEPVLP